MRNILWKNPNERILWKILGKNLIIYWNDSDERREIKKWLINENLIKTMSTMIPYEFSVAFLKESSVNITLQEIFFFLIDKIQRKTKKAVENHFSGRF